MTDESASMTRAITFLLGGPDAKRTNISNLERCEQKKKRRGVPKKTLRGRVQLLQCARLRAVMKIKALSLIYLLVASLLLAQDDHNFRLNVNVDLTELHVSVTDEKDHPIGNLSRENFRVFEDQREQMLAVFKHEDIPVSLGLVIDNSRSMEPRKQRLDAAALAFVRKSNAEDETFIVHFDDTARLDRDFTNSIPLMEETLSGVKPFGQTAIYDALILALDHMEDAKEMKKAILLLTDGVDNSSKHTLAE